MKTSLIIGMGIGNLYAKVLSEFGHSIITVDSDPNKSADFTSIDFAIEKYRVFDTVHICTPNFTHFELADKLAPYAKIVFIEKPGVQTSKQWQLLLEGHPTTRFIMVKNNMWRSNINELKEKAISATNVDLLWLNQDRVPNPGTWFTTKELAFGGVSRDLMPHLLSMYIAFNPNWRTDARTSYSTKTNWRLNQLTKTDYGIVKEDGTYDVDDECNMTFTNKWNLSSNWRTNDFDSRGILFQFPNGSIDTFDLGLCPEEAYKAMIKECVDRIDDYKFWLDQFEIDTWIHQQIENL